MPVSKQGNNRICFLNIVSLAKTWVLFYLLPTVRICINHFPTYSFHLYSDASTLVPIATLVNANETATS